MKSEEFRKIGIDYINFIADYFDNIESYPVKSNIKPGDIYSKLDKELPESGINADGFLKEFEEIIMPGITHWQSPNFFAYFPSNNSFESILGELLTSAVGVQGMIWETSPAAAELEEHVMKLLGKAIGLPETFTGVIQDTASTAALCAVLTAREKKTKFESNKKGYSSNRYRAYCSQEAHSSIEKAVKIAGIGSENMIKIPVNDDFSINISAFKLAVENDVKNGFIPLFAVAALGTTGSTAVDSIREVAAVCRKYNIFLHVDAALAGSAMLLPEKRHFLEGIESADSFVFNPHKWLFTNFDCSAYYVKDKSLLIRTFEIMPEYLKTANDDLVNNYRDWGIQLGRRFRSLKLWYVLRGFGLEGLRKIIRQHIDLANQFASKINKETDFELLAPVNFNTVCFRFAPKGHESEFDKLNAKILADVNSSGKIYITHTKLNGQYTLRFVVGVLRTEETHCNNAYNLIREIAYKCISKEIEGKI